MSLSCHSSCWLDVSGRGDRANRLGSTELHPSVAVMGFLPCRAVTPVRVVHSSLGGEQGVGEAWILLTLPDSSHLQPAWGFQLDFHLGLEGSVLCMDKPAAT